MCRSGRGPNCRQGACQPLVCTGCTDDDVQDGILARLSMSGSFLMSCMTHLQNLDEGHAQTQVTEVAKKHGPSLA